MRYFNIAGPCDPKYHYMLPATARLAENNVDRLIRNQNYFVIHAPRQVGKTTATLDLARQLNAADDYIAVMVSVEVGAPFLDDIEAAEKAVLGSWQQAIRFQLPTASHPSIWMPNVAGGQLLGSFLSEWALELPKPLVVFIDEIDALQDHVLVSVLRQLREGYYRRPQTFPIALALVGLRDVRDYNVKSGGRPHLGTASPFNVLTRSLTLRDFHADEVRTLLQQHTEETGQAFTDEAIERVFILTRGQPWLVNALAKEVVEELVSDETQPITLDHIDTAKEHLIMRRHTHLDQLTDKLRESRVRAVIEPMLAGHTTPTSLPEDDVQYVIDLGLITERGQLVIANPIYEEVIPRALTYTTQVTITHETLWYVAPDGSLDMPKLLSAFQQFFREHSEHWVERFDYKEAGPQLLLQAFLQRILNGGGRIEREYGLGRGRTDLLVLWPYGTEPERIQRVVIETKLRHGALDTLIDSGLAQTWAYMDRSAAEAGHLVIFDRTQRAWEDKIFHCQHTYQDTVIDVWGM